MVSCLSERHLELPANYNLVHWEEEPQEEREPLNPGLVNNRSSDDHPIDEEDQVRFTS